VLLLKALSNEKRLKQTGLGSLHRLEDVQYRPRDR
jgi:hypothetical protein